MFPSRRRHPLTTFRFWFFVIGSVAVTLAWRFDMLPMRIGRPETGSRAEEAFTEVDLSEPGEWEEPVRQLEGLSRPSSDAPLLAESEPSPNADAGVPPDDPNRRLSALDASAVTRLFSRSESSRPAPVPAAGGPSPPAQQDAAPAPDDEIVRTAAVGGTANSREPAPFQPAEQSISVPQTPAPTVDFTEIDRLTKSNSTADHIEAHRTLSSLYWQQPGSRGELRSRIDALAQRIYFQSQPHYMPAYEVEPGETLQSIGKHYDVTWQYLSKLNRVDPQRLRAGQRLKVIKGPFSAVIDLSDYELTVHAYGYFVTRYPVGIGKDGSTPIGTFTVQSKQVDPTYYGPDGVIEHDDPANPLGERWIDIGDSYGIHGTINPGSIGKGESRGCIRMHNDDVAAVYDLLTIGSEVTIRE